MERDGLSWTKARRKAIEEMRTGKALGEKKIDALGSALDKLDSLDKALEMMEDDDD